MHLAHFYEYVPVSSLTMITKFLYDIIYNQIVANLYCTVLPTKIINRPVVSQHYKSEYKLTIDFECPAAKAMIFCLSPIQLWSPIFSYSYISENQLILLHESHTCARAHTHTHTQFTKSNNSLQLAETAVSYTHLDVYKRQV